jgi:hypothetical protein
MATRYPNPKRVKIHRSYTVVEVAALFGNHKNTVRHWIKIGLPVADQLRPALILGRELALFLDTQRSKNKRKCKPGELFCCCCRTPKKPELGLMDFVPMTPDLGRVVALCPDCGKWMNQLVTMTKFPLKFPELHVTYTQAQERIGDTSNASVNSDFKRVSQP